MSSNSIEKFEINRRYYSQKHNSPLFILKERHGDELTFTVVLRSGPNSETKGVARIEPYRSRAQETALVTCTKGTFELSATISFEKGKKFTELPPEEQQLIERVIMKDRAERTRRSIDRSNVTTSYTFDQNGHIRYDGHL